MNLWGPIEPLSYSFLFANQSEMVVYFLWGGSPIGQPSNCPLLVVSLDGGHCNLHV